MKLSQLQRNLFFRKWTEVKAKEGWTSAQSETERHALLSSCGFSSLTLVDKTSGFDRVMIEVFALLDDLTGMTHFLGNDKRKLLFTMNQLGRELGGILSDNTSAYARAVMLDKCGHSDQDRLSIPDIMKMIFTLTNRKRAKLAREAATEENLPSIEEAAKDQGVLKVLTDGVPF